MQFMYQTVYGFVNMHAFTGMQMETIIIQFLVNKLLHRPKGRCGQLRVRHTSSNNGVEV